LSKADDGSPPRAPDEEPDELPSLTLDDALSEADVGALSRLLGDRYTPLSLLGEGTFGEVVRARDEVLGREVAIKRVRLEAFSGPHQVEDVKARFLREAQVAAQLRHPNIVTTHDIVSRDRASFIVMELMEGRDLQSLLRERGRLGLDETLEILGQAATALDHAHARGVVHRDVKPANIMIEPSGHVKVMDFGIAKVEQGGSRTSTGVVMGTPDYMSPEQARGRKVDPRADVFSLGCVLYECLSGEKPFHDDNVTAILLKVVTEEAPPIDFEACGLPRALDGVLARAMAKEPERRFASPGELLEAARQAARGVEVAPPPVAPTGTLVTTPAVAEQRTPATGSARPGPPATPVSRALPARAPGRRWVAWAVSAGAVLVLVVGAMGFVTMRERGAADTRPPAPDGRLVVEEEPGFFGRLLGREPRLFITVPEGSTLSLATRTAIDSATTRRGEALVAEMVKPMTIEGHEAIPSGARVHGRVTHVESAEEAGGRGRLTLEFSAVALPDGSRVRLESEPVELVAPPPGPAKTRRGGLAGAWDKVASAVDDIVHEVKGEGDVGGLSGAHAVEGHAGVDVEVPPGTTLDLQLTQDVTVIRSPEP
jgi:tRNA A-37 threonylcarbamoyl transferase component Bud32